jgi:hypothetical protein
MKMLDAEFQNEGEIVNCWNISFLLLLEFVSMNRCFWEERLLRGSVYKNNQFLII